MRQPRKHQVEAIDLSVDADAFALLMEQRTGKTLVVTRTAAYRARRGDITGAIVIGWPNGIQHVWAQEWPKDWPDDLPYRFVTWRSGKMNARAAEQIEAALTAPEFVVVAMNCEALLTDLAWKFLSRFLRRRRCMVVADEDWAKSPSSARTKRLLALGRHPNAVLRRFLSGTPAAEGALDLYAPFQFLNPDILGHKSFFTYRNRYAVMETGYAYGREFKTQAIDEAGRKRYQNLDELHDKIAKFSYRVRRADVSDAPPKIYQSHPFELTPRQRVVYTKLENEYFAEVRGGELPVAMAITRLLRLQQVSRNYFPPQTIGAICTSCGGAGEAEGQACERCDGFGMVVERTVLERIDPDHNPAAEALADEMRASSGPVIVWARFLQDADDAIAAARNVNRCAVAYDGRVLAADRTLAYEGFQHGLYDTIVATTGSGLSRGHDLSRAETLVYYSNSYVLRDRLQSEDRAEGLSRTVSTGIVDLVGIDTRDGPIIESLRAKRSVAEMIQGDPASVWA